jgi:hypothetical protein
MPIYFGNFTAATYCGGKKGDQFLVLGCITIMTEQCVWWLEYRSHSREMPCKNQEASNSSVK